MIGRPGAADTGKGLQQSVSVVQRVLVGEFVDALADFSDDVVVVRRPDDFVDEVGDLATVVFVEASVIRPSLR